MMIASITKMLQKTDLLFNSLPVFCHHLHHHHSFQHLAFNRLLKTSICKTCAATDDDVTEQDYVSFDAMLQRMLVTRHYCIRVND